MISVNKIKKVFSDPRKYLLSNRGDIQRVAKNTFWLGIAEAISRFLKYFLIIYVARILGATEYGKFTFALSFLALFGIVLDMGLSNILTRELAGEKEREEEFNSLLSLKIILAVVGLGLIYVFSFFVTDNLVIRKLIWILAGYKVINVFMGFVYAFLRAREKMEFEGLAKAGQVFLTVLLGFIVLFNFPSIQNLSFAYLGSSLVVLIGFLLFFHWKVFSLKIDFNTKIWRKFLKWSWPLAFTGLFATIYNNIDSTMMGAMGQVTEVGYYNAAYKIMMISIVPLGLIGRSFFPVLSRSFKESKEKVISIFQNRLELSVILGLPMVVGGVVMSKMIIFRVYEVSFSPAVAVLQILMLGVGALYLYKVFSQLVIVANKQKKIFWLTLSAAVLNIGLNLWLIPVYSLYGASIATLATFVFLAGVSCWWVKRELSEVVFRKSFLKVVGVSTISTIVMSVILKAINFQGWNIVFVVLLGVIIYFVILLGFWFLKDKIIIKT